MIVIDIGNGDDDERAIDRIDRVRRAVEGKKITNADGVNNKSYHQSGKAFDIYAFVEGKATWDHKYYEPIARHLQKVAKDKFGVDLEWGGDWDKFKDLPHFQIK